MIQVPVKVSSKNRMPAEKEEHNRWVKDDSGVNGQVVETGTVKTTDETVWRQIEGRIDTDTETDVIVSENVR